MSKASSHVVLQEQKSPYHDSNGVVPTTRHRSGSQVYSENTDRLPTFSKTSNAPRRDHIDGLGDQSNHISSKSHRRTTSLAVNENYNRHSLTLRRPSQEFSHQHSQHNHLHSSPGAMSDVPLEGPPRGKWRVFYENNRGLFYVLLAQVFGCLMNVTTRLLEIEGNHGEGMHPFQVQEPLHSH